MENVVATILLIGVIIGAVVLGYWYIRGKKQSGRFDEKIPIAPPSSEDEKSIEAILQIGDITHSLQPQYRKRPGAPWQNADQIIINHYSNERGAASHLVIVDGKKVKKRPENVRFVSKESIAGDQ